MPVAPGQPVQLADLQALAVKANQVLLPKINALIAAPGFLWPYSAYDYYFDFATPQPAYQFDDPAQGPPQNLVPAGAVYDGNGDYTVNIPDPWGWYDIIPAGGPQEVFNPGGFLNMNSGRAQRASGGNQLIIGGDQAFAGQPVRTRVSLNTQNWARELNRIRGDLFLLIFTQGLDAGLYLDEDTILSGPWVVGVNDPVTFPMDRFFQADLNTNPSHLLIFSLQGELIGLTNGYAGFRDVQFICADSDATSGLSVGSGVRNTINPVPYTVTPDGTTFQEQWDYSAIVGGELTISLNIKFDASPAGGPANPPPASAFTITNDSDLTITWQTMSNPDYQPGNNQVQYLLVGTAQQAIAAGDGTIDVTIVAPAGYTFTGISFIGSAVARLLTSSNAATSVAQGLHPSSACQAIAAADVDPAADFQASWTVDAVPPFTVTLDSTPFWKLSDTTVKGVWVAKSWAAPAVNTFIDSDIPPSVSALTNNFTDEYTVAVGGNPGALAPQASSMMQSEPAGLTPPTGSKWGSGYTAIAPSSAQWLVRKDTDFTPYDLGWQAQQGLDVSEFPDGVLQPGQTSSAPFNFLVPPDALKVIVRAVSVIAPGWPGAGGAGRQFQYGPPLAQPVQVHFLPNGAAGFTTINSQVTIPGDGGPGYLATILNKNISLSGTNPPGNNAQQVGYYVEVQTKAGPVRQYFPACWEAFSYCLDGIPAYQAPHHISAQTQLAKFIPANGYCIHKLQATRKPVANAGGYTRPDGTGTPVIVLSIGQNQLQPDGSLLFVPLLEPDNITPLTVTIPAGQYSSGPVDVFLPVLGGNELVYQTQAGSPPVALMAWANWQPIFSQLQFAMGLPNWANATSASERGTGTAFQYALMFCNQFDRRASGYPDTQFGDGQTTCRFPVPAALYNDLNALLQLV